MSTATKQNHIGRKISRIRELKDMKQEALAQALGTSQQTVSAIENSETIDDAKLEEVAKALGVSVEAIKNFSAARMGHIVGNEQRIKQSIAMKKKYSSGELTPNRLGETGFISPRRGIKLTREIIVSNDKRVKKVYQYTLDGIFLKEWEYAKDIEESKIIPKTGRMNVFRCCRGKTAQAYGFIWKYNKLCYA